MALAEGTPATLEDANRKRLLDRLARIEGQLRAVQRMISEDKECEAIAQQMAAARGALQKAFVELVTCALEHRVMDEQPMTDETHARVSELMALLTRYT